MVRTIRRAIDGHLLFLEQERQGMRLSQSLRQTGYAGKILMISDELDLPTTGPIWINYLQGEAKDEWMPLRSEKFFQNRDRVSVGQKSNEG